jgi:hypothetical protein
MGFLNEEQRKLWADKLMDLANLAFGALVFGSFLTGTGPMRWELIIGGLIIYLGLFIAAMILQR